MNKNKIIPLLFLLLLLSACQKGPLGLRNGSNLLKAPFQNPNNNPATETQLLLGTVITATAYGDHAKESLGLAFEKVAQIQEKMSRYESGSEVDLINQNAGSDGALISPDTFFVIEKSLEYAGKTKGAFNPLIGEIVDLWGIGTKKERVPTKEELGTLLPLDYNHLELSHNPRQAKLTSDQVKLDLGAIAKGYSGDVMRDVLLEEGIRSALLNLGGNVMVIGGKPDGNPWIIGIQDPLEADRGKVAAIIKAKDTSVVTSGSYERFFEQDGKRYHHIIDPFTGFPAENGIISSTIITPSSTDADALSTAVYVMGKTKALELVESLPDVEAVIITDDQKIYTTSGITDEIFELRNEGFKYEKGR